MDREEKAQTCHGEKEEEKEKERRGEEGGGGSLPQATTACGK